MNDKKHYSISDLAQEFDITTRTIRFYEEQGFLKPERDGQTRIFSVADRTRLKLILRGRRLGLSVKESAEIIDMYDPESGNREQVNRLLEHIREKQIFWEEKRQEVEQMQIELKQAEEKCLEALQKAK